MAEQLETVKQPPKLPTRRRDGHKGDYGRVLIAGGSGGMIGAPSLAANAALRGGAGLVTVATPATVQQAVAALCPCATSLPLSCDSQGHLSGASPPELAAAAEACDVLAVGPGLSQGAGPRSLVRAALEQPKPVVLDADGLNNLCRIDGWPSIRQCPLVLTPHPGEMARLTGKAVTDIQADRQAAAADAARRWSGEPERQGPPLVCVLKGAGTVVTDGRRIYVNQTGNPGMATGGSGDVLTGLIAALIGQGLAPLDAACLGVHIHGRAGDLGAEELGEVSLTASDIIDFLPKATREAG